jgi:hypothetical protein
VGAAPDVGAGGGEGSAPGDIVVQAALSAITRSSVSMARPRSLGDTPVGETRQYIEAPGGVTANEPGDPDKIADVILSLCRCLTRAPP